MYRHVNSGGRGGGGCHDPSKIRKFSRTWKINHYTLNLRWWVCPSPAASKPRGQGGTSHPPLFCNAATNENNTKNIEVTNGFIFKKHVAFLTSRLPIILCPWQVCGSTISGPLLNPTYNFTSGRPFVPFFSKLSIYKSILSFLLRRR